MTTRLEVTDKNAKHWPNHARRGRGAACCAGADGPHACCVDSFPICLCGHITPTALEMLAHVKAWNAGVRGPLKFLKAGESGWATEYRIPGHMMIDFQNGLRPNQHKIKCGCGFDSGWQSRREAVKLARLHVELACCTLLGLDAGAFRRHR